MNPILIATEGEMMQRIRCARRRFRLTGCLALTFALLFLPGSAFAAPPEELAPPTLEESAFHPGQGHPHGISVGPGLYRLNGTHPDLPDDDLGPLHFIIGNARFVGLGESVHTVGGFYEMKHRLFRYMVEEMGFRAFGFESPWVRAELAREYVATCEGSSVDAVRSLFAVWQSTEVQELLEWMCEWNQDHPNDPVHFYGFDIQIVGNANLAPLLAFLDEIGYGEGDPLYEGVQKCDGAETLYYPFEPYPLELYEQCAAALDAAEVLFEEDRVRIIRATSRDELAWAKIHLVTSQAWQEVVAYIDTDFVRGYAARDRGMASVAVAMRDLLFPGARTALWAHNGHINKNGPEASNGLTTMGTFLDEELGHKYVSIALTAHDTYVEWPWIGFCGGPENLFGPNPVEIPLAATGETHLLLDLDPRGNRPTFLEEGVDYYISGIGGDLPTHWDAVVYMQTARAMDPLFNFPPCP